MATARLLYCWELGGGYGHVRPMRWVMNCLGPGYEYTLALRSLRRAHGLFDPASETVLQAPFWDAPAQEKSALSYAEVLRVCGFESPDSARMLLDAWRRLIESAAPDAVLCDHAPGALLTARALGLPALRIGSGFAAPPAETPFPSLQPWREVAIAERQAVEARVLACLRAVFEAWGRPAPGRLADALGPDPGVILTPPGLDHYPDRPVSARYAWPGPQARQGREGRWSGARTKPKIFFYLAASTPRLLEWLRALAGRYRLCGYVRDANAGLQRDLRRAGVGISAEPLNMDWAMGSADAVLCHGGIGTVSHAAQAGVRLILVPQQLEQTLTAYRLGQRGAAAMVHPRQDAGYLDQVVRQTLAGAAGEQLAQVAGCAPQALTAGPDTLRQAVAELLSPRDSTPETGYSSS